MIPLVHTGAALWFAAVVYIFSHDALAACLSAGVIYPVREITQLQAGKGYGLGAWLMPTIACSAAYLILRVVT